MAKVLRDKALRGEGMSTKHTKGSSAQAQMDAMARGVEVYVSQFDMHAKIVIERTADRGPADGDSGSGDRRLGSGAARYRPSKSTENGVGNRRIRKRAGRPRQYRTGRAFICGVIFGRELPALAEFMTLEEVADYLRVTRKTIYRLLEKRAIPSTRVGHQWRFDRGAVDGWLRLNSSGAAASILVIDDDEGICDLFHDTLEEAGHNVTATTNPIEGLKLARAGDRSSISRPQDARNGRRPDFQRDSDGQTQPAGDNRDRFCRRRIDGKCHGERAVRRNEEAFHARGDHDGHGYLPSYRHLH